MVNGTDTNIKQILLNTFSLMCLRFLMKEICCLRVILMLWTSSSPRLLIPLLLQRSLQEAMVIRSGLLQPSLRLAQHRPQAYLWSWALVEPCGLGLGTDAGIFKSKIRHGKSPLPQGDQSVHYPGIWRRYVQTDFGVALLLIIDRQSQSSRQA